MRGFDQMQSDGRERSTSGAEGKSPALDSSEIYTARRSERLVGVKLLCVLII